jgi:murein DD-endopeptidase MepM/ murein hydrolase activator NlpD
MARRRAQIALVVRLSLPLALIFLAFGLTLATRAIQAANASPYPLTRPVPFHPRSARSTPTASLIARVRVPVEARLGRGETVTQVFASLGLAGESLRQAVNAFAESADLRTLQAGYPYSAFFDPAAALASFELTLTGQGRVTVERQGDGWKSDYRPFSRSVVVRSIRGTLDGSFEGSIRAAGGPPMLAYRLGDVFQWDLDFNRDLRRGDRFEVLFEEVFLEGEPYEVGAVHAAAYENRGRRLEAYRFAETGGGYYDAEGRPLRKSFLRSPLKYSRVTSRFSHRRFHPVLKSYRPHYGVDYGAAVGTPVHVTANGEVVFAGWDRGGGKVVKVRHPGGYVTAYLHLSRYAKGIRSGARVRQGDVIAYSGATGLATGPHLDYRVQHKGRWIDPLTLKGVRDEPIAGAQLASFSVARDQLRASLAGGNIPPFLTAKPGPSTQRAVDHSEPAASAPLGTAR